MAVLLVLPLVIAAATVEVRVDGERVSVRAEQALLSEVLDRIAEKTGMRVVWSPNLGRPLVTTKLEDCTPAEAVLKLMRGTVLNYALTTDPSGARVQTLLVVGGARPALDPRAFLPRQAEGQADPGGVEAGDAEPETESSSRVNSRPAERPAEPRAQAAVRPPRARP